MNGILAQTRAMSWVNRRWFERLLEIIPGVVSWSILIAPIPLSMVDPLAVAYFIIAFDLYWMLKSFRLSYYLVRGYHRLHVSQRIDWQARLEWLKEPAKHLVVTNQALTELKARYPLAWWGPTKVRRRYRQLREDQHLLAALCAHDSLVMRPEEIYNAVIMAVSVEPQEIVEPSVKALTHAEYPGKQMMLVIAYEERCGEEAERISKLMIERYGEHFALAIAVKHPDGVPGEVRGKGPNISHAGQVLTEEVRKRGLHPEQVVVTTFDADHRASGNYFACLAFTYASDPNRVRKSFQPIPMFYNNIWDAPAPMRVIAAGNSFWLLMETMRPRRLRNFAAHAQSLAALIATDYWSRTSIVEDGHQFWRTYFTYDGDHSVVPLYACVYQDAVLSDTYIKTIKAQYKQLRRWAWGASDFSYAVRNAILNRQIPWSNKLVQIGRLFESHVSWATAPLLLTFVGYLPLVLSPRNSIDTLPHLLPIITSRIMQIASVGIVVTIFISMISLPPRPERYRRTKNVFMVLQWLLLPVTSIAFSSFAAIESQTRLIFNRRLESFDITDKAVKKP
ncbi:MAG TPA: hypothetical protein VLF67_01155 [Candidatus Saccharimonas sp.]|nr:hypothetical protein [Candidatus Saccharimonas sp.]